jgi:hypothetical protein
MTIRNLRRQALGALRPPPKLRLSDWLEASVRLPEGVSAMPGPLRLWPYQREIADAIVDPTIERVTGRRKYKLRKVVLSPKSDLRPALAPASPAGAGHTMPDPHSSRPAWTPRICLVGTQTP